MSVGCVILYSPYTFYKYSFIRIQQRVKESKIITMSVLLMLTSKVQAIPNKMSAGFFQDLDNLILELILKDNSP